MAESLAGCEVNHVPSVAAVQPLHIAAWIEMQAKGRGAPIVKVRLPSIRHLFDWRVTEPVMPVNPASQLSVRPPRTRPARRRCSRMMKRTR